MSDVYMDFVKIFCADVAISTFLFYKIVIEFFNHLSVVWVEKEQSS